LIRVRGIDDLEREIFGPVLHIATFRAHELGAVIDAVNASGYGLTFGLHTRIDDRVQMIADTIRVGNIYANRNQIGAIVGSQPFGGEGLSGTGPKAGGPHYLVRFTRRDAATTDAAWLTPASPTAVSRALAAEGPAEACRATLLPGPTGELNRLSEHPRPPLLCLGPGLEAAQAQAALVRELGGRVVVPDGELSPGDLEGLPPFGAALFWGEEATGRAYARALAEREGPIVPLVTGRPDTAHAHFERHLCVDTTAAGGNASLLAGGHD